MGRDLRPWEDETGSPVTVTRSDHTAPELRGLAAKTADAAQARRMLALAMVLEGAKRVDAARVAGMDRQTLRDWVHRHNETGVTGLISRVPPGATPKLTDVQIAELRALVIAGPDPNIHKVIRWRCVDLREEAARCFSVTVDEGTIGKWLNKLGLTGLQPRPSHPKKDLPAREASKKRARIGGPPVAVETDRAIVARRGAAESFLVDLSPLKNVVHGRLRTCEW